MFSLNETVRVVDVANVRRTPGNQNKDGFDVFTSVHPGQTFSVVDGPHEVDGLTWYGLAIEGEVGYVVESVHGETVLASNAQPAAPTAGTQGGICLSRPVRHEVVISQLWGENPEFYAQIQGYPAPLRGHNGVDFAAIEGESAIACDDGVVERAGMDPWGFGNLCVLRHSWGKSYYAHLSAFDVAVGQHVGRGQHIARTGSTGLGMGAGGAGQDHLHFSIKIDGQDDGANGWGGFSNPMDYMEGQW